MTSRSVDTSTSTLPATALSSDAIAALTGGKLGIEIVALTGSTNADLMQRCESLDQPVALIAIEQTAGKGRAGRGWIAPPDAAITFSVAWPFFNKTPAQLSGLSLAIGVSLAATLRQQGLPVQLKWPNDLILDDGKLGGILIESKIVRHCLWTVIGVGLNVHDEIDHSVAIGQQTGRRIASVPLAKLARDNMNDSDVSNRDSLIGRLLRDLEHTLTEFNTAGLAPFIARWQSWHAYQNQTVTMMQDGETIATGLATGIDATGHLLLQCADGQVLSIAAGDVSLRPLDIPAS